jgi:hypothetical protein
VIFDAPKPGTRWERIVPDGGDRVITVRRVTEGRVFFSRNRMTMVASVGTFAEHYRVAVVAEPPPKPAVRPKPASPQPRVPPAPPKAPPSAPKGQTAFTEIIERDTAASVSVAGKNPAAVSLGRLGGIKGGPARAAALTPRRKRDIARKAAAARWAKPLA